MKNNSLTLSIVIPVYNEERYLKVCLESIKKQTLKPDEVIVVDNNSQDKTKSVARSYNFVKVINEPTQGVYFGRAAGFKVARSDLIGRIDGDTVLPEDWIKRIKADFNEHPGISAVTGPVIYYDMPFRRMAWLIDQFTRRSTYELSPKSPFLYGSNMAVRRKDWLEASKQECQQRDIHEDIDLAIHLYRQGKKILYDGKLLIGASGRRLNEKPIKYLRYVWMYQRTFHKHGLHHLAMYWAMFLWSAGYLLFHPWRNLWYSIYSSRHEEYPFTREVRKNPMSK